ncbi:MAG TPA: NAD(P)-binding domain-containing protein [Candidatus Stackebrandtia excrementipullorum]|nr:NAD(P)-binding domain-containing protein [Candidatus Stackebrandtia excrementipullorum]
MSQSKKYPAQTVVVIGAGPVGLAAASHLVSRNITPIVIEAGDGPGAAISRWGHIRLFSPWRFNIDAAARRILQANDWVAPNLDHLPTGAELVDQYLHPLAESAELAPHIQYGTEVVAVSRSGVDKTRTIGRDDRPYLVRTRTADGVFTDVIADAVIDASGTWGHANPLGAHGIAAPGESEAAWAMAGALPDVLGSDRDQFAGKHTLVVGTGHSAANTLIALATLEAEETGTRISWAIRGESAARLYGGGDADALPARGKLGTDIKQLVADGRVTLMANFVIDELRSGDGAVTVTGRSADEPVSLEVDVIAGATGFRPDLGILREIRLDMDASVEAPAALAPLIDPNFHSCGTVPAHGEKDLAHPDEGFYIVGMKSYGRAPTFLMATGYEQVRSVAAALAGDRAAADEVHLELPETGVCSSGPTITADDGSVVFDKNTESCCGPAADTSCSTDSTSSCGSTPPARGLSTGLLHGYSGEITGDSEASSGCGPAPATDLSPGAEALCCSTAPTAANA